MLSPGSIELTVRNTGPDPVQVAQVFVNDAYVDFTGGTEPIGRLGTRRLTLDYPWQERPALPVSMLTSTGAGHRARDPGRGRRRPPPTRGFFGSMALLGTYVGIIPVLLGMLFLPGPAPRRPARGPGAARR